MSFISLRVAVAASLILASGAANAELHKFEYTGTVNYSADASVAVGTQIHGQFSYDDTLVNGDPMPGYGWYFPTTPISANVSGHAVDTDQFTVKTYDNFGDAWDIVDLYGQPVMYDDQVFPQGVLVIHLQTPANGLDALDGVGLPMAYDMSKWSPTLSYGQILHDGSSDGGFIQFTIDAIVALPLPPPPCLKQNGKDAKKICWTH